MQEEGHYFIINWNPSLRSHPVVIGHFLLTHILGVAKSLGSLLQGQSFRESLAVNLLSLAHPGDSLITHPSSQTALSFQVQYCQCFPVRPGTKSFGHIRSYWIHDVASSSSSLLRNCPRMINLWSFLILLSISLFSPYFGRNSSLRFPLEDNWYNLPQRLQTFTKDRKYNFWFQPANLKAMQIVSRGGKTEGAHT